MIPKKQPILTNLIIFNDNNNNNSIPDFDGNTNNTNNNNTYLPKLKNIIRVFLGEKPTNSKKNYKIVSNSYINSNKQKLKLFELYNFDKMHLFSPIGVSNNKSLAAVNKLTNYNFGFVSQDIEGHNIFYSKCNKTEKYEILKTPYKKKTPSNTNILKLLFHYLSNDKMKKIKKIINKNPEQIIDILFTILKYKIGGIEYRELNNNNIRSDNNNIVTKIKHDYKNIKDLTQDKDTNKDYITRINYILQYSIKLYKLITYCKKFINASNSNLQVKFKDHKDHKDHNARGIKWRKTLTKISNISESTINMENVINKLSAQGPKIYNIDQNKNLLFHPYFESIIKSSKKNQIQPNNKFNINLTNKKVIQLYNDLYKYNKNIHYKLNDKPINLLLTQFEKVSPRYTNNMLFKCVRNINKLLNKINSKNFLTDLYNNIQFYTSIKYVKLITDKLNNEN